jgi:hypothetical protein
VHVGICSLRTARTSRLVHAGTGSEPLGPAPHLAGGGRRGANGSGAVRLAPPRGRLCRDMAAAGAGSLS